MRTVTYDENEWVLVPRIPTREMIDAYLDNDARFSSAQSDWYVMLAAAPDHPDTAGDAEDAKRYRWLKDNALIDWHPDDGIALVIPEPDTGRNWKADTDAAIDAAMRASKGGE